MSLRELFFLHGSPVVGIRSSFNRLCGSLGAGMTIFIWLGALLTIVGVLYLVKQVIWQGPLSGPIRRRPPATLEPRTGPFSDLQDIDLAWL